MRSREGVCAFWLGGRCFGFGVSLVGEVVAVPQITPVPLSKPEMLGLFNLRGTPVPLLDLAGVLSFEDANGRPRAEATSATALVLKTPLGLLAVQIDRVEMVVSGEDRGYRRTDARGEHPAVDGFIELDARRTVTVLDSSVVLDRLEKLRMGA